MPHNTSQWYPGMPSQASQLSPPDRLSSNVSPTTVKQTSSTTSIEPLVASAQYVKQCQAVVEQQRKAIEAERELWNIERENLHQRIAALQESLQRSEGFSSIQRDQTSHILDTRGPRDGTHPAQKAPQSHKPEASHSSGAWSAMSTNGSRRNSDGSIPTSSISVGEQILRGHNLGMTPKRRFSGDFAPGKASRKMPSISEDSTQEKHVSIHPKAEQIPRDSNTSHKGSIAGVDIDRDLEGINFNRSAVDPEIVKSIESSRSASALASPTFDTFIPPMSPPKPTIPNLSKLQKDPYTMDAGNTPMARHSRPLLVGDGAVSGPDSKTTTPAGPFQPQDIPENAEPAPLRPPSERQDSYFPNPEGSSDSAVHHPVRQPIPAEPIPAPMDEDPALTGPLGLTNEPEGDAKFLDAVTNRLRTSAPDTGKPNFDDDRVGDGRSDDDGEPGIRLKRSMNFGSQLGGKGRGSGGRGFGGREGF